MSEPFYFRPARAPEQPLLVSIPHTGTEVPAELAARFAAAEVGELPDTDWHLHDVYDFAAGLGARTLFARYSRYLIDLNRAPDSSALYPGRFETGLVPTRTFAGTPVYAPGDEPDADEIAQRRARYFDPYHARLARELEDLRSRFGYALLWDAHSIRSHVPLMFTGHLPELVLGDADETSAAPPLCRAVVDVLAGSGYTHAHNRPFRGGYITRTFGRPREHVHALQLEMAQDIYMVEAPPFALRPDRAHALADTLATALETFVRAARTR